MKGYDKIETTIKSQMMSEDISLFFIKYCSSVLIISLVYDVDYLSCSVV